MLQEMKRKHQKIPRKIKTHQHIVRICITEHVQGYEISNSLENIKTYVKSFSGAKIRDMQDYIKPTLRENPD